MLPPGLVCTAFYSRQRVHRASIAPTRTEATSERAYGACMCVRCVKWAQSKPNGHICQKNGEARGLSGPKYHLNSRLGAHGGGRPFFTYDKKDEL
jgi:hypothetical protein